MKDFFHSRLIVVFCPRRQSHGGSGSSRGGLQQWHVSIGIGVWASMSIDRRRGPGQIIAVSKEVQPIVILCTVAVMKAATVIIIASIQYSIPRFGGGSGGVGWRSSSIINYIRSPDLMGWYCFYDAAVDVRTIKTYYFFSGVRDRKRSSLLLSLRTLFSLFGLALFFCWGISVVHSST